MDIKNPWMGSNSSLCFAESPDRIPDKMIHGSVIVYDEQANPILEKGGYDYNENAYSVSYEKPFQKRIPITSDMSKNKIELVEWENSLCEEATKNLDNLVYVDNLKIYPNMKVVYNSETGYIDNILYKNDSEISGYSIDNPFDTSTFSNPTGTYSWGRHNNTLTRQSSGSVLGEDRATVFYDSKGNRYNRLGYKDCATQQYYNYSRKGDQPVSIRNLNTNDVFTFYQADVGALPDAIIDIWGDNALDELAGGTANGSVYKVRYYHKKFSDQ